MYITRMERKAKEDVKEINRLKGLLPGELTVDIRPSKDGGLVCEIKTFPGCFTQGDNLSDLMEMINDAAYTYFDIPQKYIPRMPKYNPSAKMAHDFSGFPLPAKKNIRLKLFDREAAKN
jgi:predicted RNase H-like HicB family nuclease